jgi:hypothetical protein
MTNLVRLFPRECKPTFDAATRLGVRVLHDDVGPLTVIIPTGIADRIRSVALWSGKDPEEFAVAFLCAGFPLHGGR